MKFLILCLLAGAVPGGVFAGPADSIFTKEDQALDSGQPRDSLPEGSDSAAVEAPSETAFGMQDSASARDASPDSLPQEGKTGKKTNFFFQYLSYPIVRLVGGVADTSFVVEYIAHPVLKIITWPLEKIVVPIAELAIFPAKPPLEYMTRENVLERAIDLMSFGSEQQFMLYPVMVITTGTGSTTGFTFRDQSLFGRSTEQLVLYYLFFVNGNQRVKLTVKARDIGGSQWGMNMDLGHQRYKNVSIPQPATDSNLVGNYSDTSSTISVLFSHPLIGATGIGGGFYYQYHEFGEPAPGFDKVQCGDGYFFKSLVGCKEKRGINQKFHDVAFELSFGRNTVNNNNLPTYGSLFETSARYHIITKNHDYIDWRARFLKFFFLGVEKYEISPAEQKELGPINFARIKKAMKYDNLKKQLFNRKVIATQVSLAQTFDVSGSTPVYGLQSIGNSTPLRGYGGTPFRDYAMGALSVEYRFPLIRLVEATIFDEYGVVGNNLAGFQPEDIVNSWGFGFQMSRTDIYLFRAQLGFHGSDIAPFVNITVDTVY